MNLRYLSSSLSRNAGGIFEIILALAQELQNAGHRVVASGLVDDHWEVDKPRWKPVETDPHRHVGPGTFGFSRSLRDSILNQKDDLLHLHTMWMHPSMIATQWQRRTNRPLVLTPNGMLEPWALGNSAWKKRIATVAYERRMLNAASALHANTSKELGDVRKFGIRAPVAVIPNGVHIPHEKDRGTKQSKSRPKLLLYVGRIHQKKGLPMLIRAWDSVTKHSRAAEEWALIIAGWDQAGHEQELKDLAKGLGLSCASRGPGDSAADLCEVDAGQIKFVGPAFGADKTHLLTSADAFVLPSYSEGLPMAVLEAWAHQLPVVMTDRCNLSIGFEKEAALRTDCTDHGVENAIRAMIEASDHDRISMGERGHRLVVDQFSWKTVAAQMETLYAWLLEGGPKPDFVSI